MALIKCPECDKEISSEALSCPHCGYSLIKSKYVETVENTKNKITDFINQNKRKITITVILLLVVLITIGIINNIKYHKQLEYDLSLDAYTTIVKSLRDYKYDSYKIEQIKDSTNMDKIEKIKEITNLSFALSCDIDTIEDEYKWLNDSHKSELKKWITENLNNDEKSEICNEVTNSEIKEFFN